MSAITGIFYRDGRKVDPDLIKKMNNRLSHRGPDGSDVWCEGSIALGHQMLWTTPESLHEKLPFEDDDSGLVITADARIDNRNELSKELCIEDKEEVSDSYFILKAYEKWGENCPEHLLGDFAFSIWDKNNEKLFCARDHMGVKPFYYYLDEDIFVFGTEIKALLCVPGVPCELNKRKVAFFLMRDRLNREFTFFENIKSLDAAHFFILNQCKLIKKEYWKLDPNLNIMMDSEEDYAKAFRDIFAEAVRCRLRSYFPIGFELSGGLDSSSIVCMVKKLLIEEQIIDLKVINTYSSVYDEIQECDERYYIEKVLDNKVNSTFLNGDSVSPLKNIDHILWYQDQPFFSPHMANQTRSYHRMNNDNIRVLFSGEGGDQIVSHGGNYLKELFFTFKWEKFIRELNGYSHDFKQSRSKIFIKEVIFPSIPYSIKKFISLILGRRTDSILNKSFLKKLKIKNVDINSVVDYLGKIKTKKFHYFSINMHLNKMVFEIIDRGTANFNIEVRYPFFDKRLIEFCYSIPTEMKIKYGWDRYIMRIAMDNILPPEIQWRHQKANLSNVYKRNLMLFEENTLKQIIYDDNTVISEYVDLENLQFAFEKYRSKKKQDLFDIWLVIVLYFWIKFTYSSFKN